jgi:superfamily II DNA or RNA helicase
MVGDGQRGGDAQLVIGIPASVKKLSRKQLATFEVVIFDEAHLMSSTTWFEIATLCDNAYVRVALSGTLSTRDAFKDSRIESMTGPVVPVVTAGELIEKGVLAKPYIYMVRFTSSDSYPSYKKVRDVIAPGWRENRRLLSNRGSDLYGYAYAQGITNNDTRNATGVMLAKQAALKGSRVLMLCQRVEHGSALCRFAQSVGVPNTIWLWGEGSTETRQDGIAQFRSAKDGALLIASTIFDIGVDIPEIDTLILMGAGKSPIKTIQRIGRALRPRPDKTSVNIYDFMDGRTLKEPKDYLGTHAALRRQEYVDAGYMVGDMTIPPPPLEGVTP